MESNSSLPLIGLDISSRHLRYGIVTSDGTLQHFHREPYTTTGDPAGDALSISESIFRAMDLVLNEAQSPIAGIAIGIPGLVNHTTNQPVMVPRLPGLPDVDLGGALKSRYGVSAYFENNTHAATAAEMTSGAMQGTRDGLFLRIGNRIGAGLVLDGKLRRGKSGFAGEIGHLNIDPDGIECFCGSHGCLETIASAPNIVRRTLARLERDSTSSLSLIEKQGRELSYLDIIQAAEDGDDLAQLMMRRTGGFIGMAVADTLNLLNLSQVVIAGTMAARLLLIPGIEEEVRKRTISLALADCSIIPAKLGSEAGVIGVAILARAQLSSQG